MICIAAYLPPIPVSRLDSPSAVSDFSVEARLFCDLSPTLPTLLISIDSLRVGLEFVDAADDRLSIEDGSSFISETFRISFNGIVSNILSPFTIYNISGIHIIRLLCHILQEQKGNSSDDQSPIELRITRLT